MPCDFPFRFQTTIGKELGQPKRSLRADSKKPYGDRKSQLGSRKSCKTACLPIGARRGIGSGNSLVEARESDGSR
jgi:hypothetical protein